MRRRLAALAGSKSSVSGAVSMEKVTDYKDASTYNNFYEFGTEKDDPARTASALKPRPWTVAVEGEAQGVMAVPADDIGRAPARRQRPG